MRLRHGIAAVMAALLLLTGLSGCGKAGDISKVELDYGISDIYLKQEVDDAAKLVLAEFRGWKGCQLHNLRYVGDACNNELSVRKVNIMWDGPGFDQHIEFISSFSTSKSVPKSLGLQPNQKYTDWHWHLGRGKDQEWHLVYWGEK